MPLLSGILVTAQDDQREASLQDFIDKMSALLLEKDLRNSKKDDEIQKIARVRTLTMLPRLDPQRKKSLLQFLYEADLMNMTHTVVLLSGANLSGAIFTKDQFSKAMDITGIKISTSS